MNAPLKLRAIGLAFLLAAACGQDSSPLTASRQDLAQGFAAGSLVIPMDTTYQDQGTLTAFGLLDALLRARVPVSLTIASGKALGGVDFTAAGTDVRSGTAVPSHGYRGGPFVIDSVDRAAALPVIRGWQSSVIGQSTTVHDISTPFSAEVRRRLTAAPHIGVFLDGFEYFAFGYLNAAGIPDSVGQAWPVVTASQTSYPGYPDILTAAAIKGGALVNADGTPAYCAVSSMHYLGTPDDLVVAAVRQYLTGAGTAAQFECEAAHAFENSPNGHFLTTLGIQDDRTGPLPLPNPNAFLFPDNPHAQIDGTFTAVTGMLQSIGLVTGSAFKGNGVTLVEGTPIVANTRIAYLTGFLDGVTTNGKVSYLAGHQYPVTLPISANPSTNGVRLYLDATYQSTCTAAEGQPNPALTMTGPPFTNGSAVTFTISYTNPGPGSAIGAVLTDTLPAGLSFVSASAGAIVSGQTVSWNLGNLKAGASGTVTVTASVATDGTYINQAVLAFLVSLTPRTVTGSATSTVRDTTPPRTSIVSEPDLMTHTADATFGFISSKPGSSFQCSLDGGAPAACTSPTTYPALPAGKHTFTVTATDPAGNLDPNPPTYTWTLLPPNVLAMTGGGCSSGGGADLPALFALLALAAALRYRPRKGGWRGRR
jgi:uncharacterized repeat protein (TIGR01451 family)/MYXO-CTERM domain-containing protein